jgi:hypothetical protein
MSLVRRRFSYLDGSRGIFLIGFVAAIPTPSWRWCAAACAIYTGFASKLQEDVVAISPEEIRQSIHAEDVFGRISRSASISSLRRASIFCITFSDRHISRHGSQAHLQCERWLAEAVPLMQIEGEPAVLEQQ